MSTALFAQAPKKMSYQAVIRDASGNLVASKTIGMRISILQGSLTGAAVYVETHAPTANANGLVTLQIGTGAVVTGDFATLNWAQGPYFIKTETDPAAGTNYTISAASELLSVPYALHAETAATAGVAGSAGSLEFADFYALSPSDNFVPVSPGDAVSFPQNAVASNGIQHLNQSTFMLSDPGVYQVFFQVSVQEPGQLVINLNGVDLAYTVAGRATGTSQIVGMALIQVPAFSFLQVKNPQGSPIALSVAPFAGGVHPVSAHLVITRLR